MELNGDRQRLLAWTMLLFLLALVFREYYVLTARVSNPFLGDAKQYASYAFNMVEHGVFSSSPPGSIPVVPDAYRGPGYAVLIAAAMVWSGASSPDWYSIVLHAQAWLGSATVAVCLWLGWTRHRPATGVFAAILLAFWPNHVTATGALLSEVLLGFLLACAAQASLSARERGATVGALAGLVWGWAFLVNPVVLFVPIGFAAWYWRLGRRSSAFALAGSFAVIVLAWGLRNAVVDTPHQPGRATVNFVQGSWPLYHDAWLEMRTDRHARQIIDSIDEEIALLDARPAFGMSRIVARIAADPGYYAYWYTWKKPFLLWDWDIRIGSGRLYVVQPDFSPYEYNRLFFDQAVLLRAANPLIFLLALGAILTLAVRRFRRAATNPAMAAIGMLFVYFTAVHVVFQAEPRYSIPYRFLEFLLAASVATGAVMQVGQWLATNARKTIDGG